MERCILLSARRYEFQDDKGKAVAGVTLTYLTDEVQTEGDTRGCQPLSVSAPLDVWPQLGTLPGVYDLDFKQRPGPKGKPTLTLVRLVQCGPLDMAGLYDDAA
jgi:hypothetical protein